MPESRGRGMERCTEGTADEHFSGMTGTKAG